MLLKTETLLRENQADSECALCTHLCSTHTVECDMFDPTATTVVRCAQCPEGTCS